MIIKDGVIFYTMPYEGEKELGLVADGQVENGIFAINGCGIDLNKYPELRDEWDKLPPKPVIEVPPIVPQPTTEDYLLDFEYRLSKLELGV